jgi:alpha-N-arabinofuranosidase
VLAAVAALPITACGGCKVAEATLRLQPTMIGGPVPKELFGTNLQWTGAGDGALVSEPGGAFAWNQALLRLVADGGLNLMRFPGGALANTYRWRIGVGPRGGRPAGKNFVGADEASIFGSDELIAFAARSGAQLLLTANAAAGPEEAADWVEYMNGGPATAMGALRLRNTGAPAPGVRWWEVGNELYSPKEPGHAPAAAYARTVVAFREAMRRRDPTVRVGAMLEGSFQSAAWMAGVMPELPGWNAAVVRACGADIDFVSLHFSAPYDTVWPDDRLRELTLAGNLVLRKTIGEVRSLLAEVGRPRLPILVTEYTAFYGGGRPELVAGLDGALFDALVLIELMRQPNVVAAANWSLVNDGAFGLAAGEGGQLKPRPSFDMLRRLRTFAGLPIVGMDIQGPAYATAAKGSIPALPRVPILDGVAVALSPGRYRLAVVNRSACTAVATQLGPGSRVVEGGPATSPAFRPGDTRLNLPASSLTVVDLAG